MSAAAWFDQGTVRFIRNELDDVLTPSVVAVDPRTKNVVTGRIAKDLLASDPACGAALFKRSIGVDGASFSMGDRSFTPIELSAYILDSLRRDAERTFGEPVQRCVITVPAYFNEAQRRATLQAGQIAGLSVERIVNEPTAAAIAYGLNESPDELRFVVLDLGGGTFDVCVMEYFDGLLEVKSVAGKSQLGGEDFTRALLTLGLDKAGIPESSLSIGHFGLMLRRAELVKRQLARWPSATLNLADNDAEPLTVDISAEEASEAFQPLLSAMLEPCRTALRGNRMHADEVDDVILVGGGTRMPCVRQFAEDLFQREPKMDRDVDLVVVRGAAIQAALHAGDEALEDVVVTDVASHSLGISSSREISGRRIFDLFSPVIERNTVIPTSRSDVFATLEDNQTELSIEVYEGELRQASANRKLGEFTVKRIPKGPAGQQVSVRFTYDLSGILEVEATVLETGESVAHVFKRGREDLSDTEIERATQRMQGLKSDPRERPHYRDLLTRAHLLYQDSTGEHRARISYYLDQFESALSTSTPKTIEAAFNQLSEVCQRLDGGERW